ncbi:sodium:proton antiporter [Limosilactobacillus fermentum]|nr:sodium:proton antiporter [Limosilactobacillus fermentum]
MAECVLIVLSPLVPTIVFRLILKPTTTDTELEGEVTKARQAMVNQAIARIKQIYLPEDLRRRVLYDLNAQIANTTTRQFIQEVRQVVAKPALPIEQRQLLEEAYRLAFQEERGYLAMVTQLEEKYRPAMTSLYREIIMAEMVIFSSNDD